MTIFHRISAGAALCALACILLTMPGTARAEAPIRNGETFGNWIFECVALGESQTACGLSQTIVANEGKDVLAKISLGREEGTENMVLSAMLPLSLDLTQPVELQADRGRIEIGILSCFPTGCLGRSVLSAEELSVLAETSSLSVSLKLFQGTETASIPASPEGLREGMARVKYLP